MAKPISPTQQAAIDIYANALDPADQVVFRERVIDQLVTTPELGDGLIYRTCAVVQRELFRPPADDVERHRPQPLRRFA